MKVAVRVDQSSEIGSGHLQRCLTLALGLSELGGEITFYCRKVSAPDRHLLESRGFEVKELKSKKQKQSDRGLEDNPYQSWLGVSEEEDADDCVGSMSQGNHELVIVDHYALGEKWERRLIPHCQTIVVLDDLANRRHACDILVDQTYARNPQNYLGLVPDNCTVVAGSQFSVLRQEFLKHRHESLLRRRSLYKGNLLISFGGSDLDNVTIAVLASAKRWIQKNQMAVTVVLGANAPHADEVRAFCSSQGYSFVEGTNRMAELMASNDLCIGGAGTSTWERFCLGLPSIAVKTADNQSTVIDNLTRENLLWRLDSVDIANNLDAIGLRLTDDALATNGQRISKLVDGYGVRRVIDLIRARIDAA